MTDYNFSKVTPKLWQGGYPPEGRSLADLGVDVLVLAAEEHQPQDERFPGVEVLRVPLFDQSQQSIEDFAAMIAAGHQVAQHLARGKTVLSTCQLGLNRSGVISALALCNLGVPPKIAISAVRRARGPWALSNKTFEHVVRSYPS
jgi:protein-tyrosine phosphatase